MRRRSLVLLLAAVALVAGCRRGEPPVAEVRVTPATLTLPYPELRELELELVPRVEREALGEQPVVFVHLLDEPGSVVRTFDYPLPADWRPGEPRRDWVRLLQSALAPPLPEGDYELTVGLYDAASGARFPLAGGHREVDRYEYAVARVEVPASPGPLPYCEYSPEWREVEGSPDRQILTSRWLGAQSGRLRVAQLAAGGFVYAQLYVPPGPEPGGRFVVLPGEHGPVVTLRSTCGPEELVISGAGRQWLEWQVPAGLTSCDFDLEANLLFAGERGEQRRSVRLELLAWQPPPGGR